jgi:hypothetical protein
MQRNMKGKNKRSFIKTSKNVQHADIENVLIYDITKLS